MPASESSHLSVLVKVGSYRAALEHLQRLRRNQDSIDYRVLECELLQRTGQYSVATESAATLSRQPNLPKPLLSRLQVVVGDCARLRGDSKTAGDRYRRAAILAVQADDHEQLCWVQLRQLVNTGDAQPLAAIGFLPELRRLVIRLGNPSITAALHLFVGQIETQRGLLDTGRRHLNIAKQIIDAHPNLWLEGTASIDSMCLAYLSSDLPEALDTAVRALELAETSGFDANRRAAVTNLGHLHLLLGNSSLAEQYLVDALNSSVGSRNEAAAVDGLARLRIQQKRLDDARELLARIEPIAASFAVPPYEIRWSRLTLARLLIEQGTIKEADELLQQTCLCAEETGDVQLGVAVRLMQAEAALLMKDLYRADGLVRWVKSVSFPLQIETLGQVYKLSGRMFSELGHNLLGSASLDRSCHLFGTIGNRSAVRELTLSGSVVTGVLLEGRLETSAMRVASRWSWKPMQALLELTSADWCGLAIDRVSALFEQRALPELMEKEITALLSDAECLGPCELVSHQLGDGAHSIGQPLDGFELWLGVTKGRCFHLVSKGSGDPRTRHLWASIRLISDCAAKLRQFELNQREHAALWPVIDGAGQGAQYAESASINAALTIAQKLGTSNVTILITGETGTGKEVLARAIHDASRPGKPFIPFNCATVPRDILESQLFGHRRGAFTGAHDHAPGVIRSAAGGTLFLDEVGDLSPDVQPKLLRFLESAEIHPLGEPQPVKVDVRIIAATNVSLDDLVAQNRFREDLFYRLNVIRFRIPPLRDRREEIPLLVGHFLRRYGEEFKKDHLRLAEETMEYLLLFSWPGNVRQLANELRRMVALAEPGAVLMPEHLSPDIAASRRTLPPSDRALDATEIVVRLDQPMAAAVDHVERAMLQYALKSSGGRVEPAARMLGLSRKGLYLKRQRLGMHVAATA